MRLDDFDPNDIDVGQARGGGFGGGGGGGGLLLGLLPLIGSRFGCGGIVVVLILLAVFGGLGNLGSIVGMGGGGPSVTQQSGPQSGAAEVTRLCTTDANAKAACNAFDSAQETWEAIFAQQGAQFQKPGLRFFSGNAQSGCGAAQSAMGPFYCPSDNDIYIDTSFFDELAKRFGAAGDFAQYYVIAHEFGHHIQHLTGAADQVRQIQQSGSQAQGNAASVKLELQADCYAGVWAARNRARLDPGDVEEGLTAASAIGDDKLSGNRAAPESFTHGTSAQRMFWLKRGIDTGNPAACDTFTAAL